MKLNLDSFQADGATYIRLYLSCPVCMKNGKPTEPAFWFHYDNNCHGDIYVGENAWYKCGKCGHSAHVLEWKYNCPGHSSSPDEFIGADAESVAATISVAGQLVETAGIPWLQSFLANLQRAQDRRGYGAR